MVLVMQWVVGSFLFEVKMVQVWVICCGEILLVKFLSVSVRFLLFFIIGRLNFWVILQLVLILILFKSQIVGVLRFLYRVLYIGIDFEQVLLQFFGVYLLVLQDWSLFCRVELQKQLCKRVGVQMVIGLIVDFGWCCIWVVWLQFWKMWVLCLLIMVVMFLVLGLMVIEVD